MWCLGNTNQNKGNWFSVYSLYSLLYYTSRYHPVLPLGWIVSKETKICIIVFRFVHNPRIPFHSIHYYITCYECFTIACFALWYGTGVNLHYIWLRNGEKNEFYLKSFTSVQSCCSRFLILFVFPFVTPLYLFTQKVENFSS